MSLAGVIKTSLKEQRLEKDDERGVRCWRSAELVGEGWYVVEHCFETNSEEREVRQWVATSIAECARLMSAEGALWSRLLAYLRTPLSAGSGFVFAEVTEVYEVGSSSEVLLRFADGMTVLMPTIGEERRRAMAHAEELRLIFSKHTFASRTDRGALRPGWMSGQERLP